MGLRDFRKKERYSMQQVADLLGVNLGTIFRIEQGIQDPTIKQIKELSKLYKVSIKQIVDAYEEQDGSKN